MQRIIYNISNAYFPVTVYLKSGLIPGTTIVATNIHNFAGEYTFEDIADGQYTIHVVDAFGCEVFKNVPPDVGGCDLEGVIECELTTTGEPTTTEIPTTTLAPTTTELPTTTIEPTTTVEPTTTESPTTTIESTTTIEPTTTEAPFLTVEYGLLYNWYAATDVRNITSSDDWIVPSNTDYDTLCLYVGDYTDAGGYLKETGFVYWDSPNTSATNSYGFNLRGSGIRNYSNGLYSLLKSAHWGWTTGSWSSSSKRAFRVFNNNAEANAGNGINMIYGNAIRLLYVGSGTPTSYTGNDGKVYRVVTIGTQTWLADNLCETKFRNGDVIPWYGANPLNYFTDAEWIALSTAGVCAYDNDVNNVAEGFSFPT